MEMKIGDRNSRFIWRNKRISNLHAKKIKSIVVKHVEEKNV